MNIDSSITYAADPGTVITMTFDPEFQKLKCRATGALDFNVDVTAHGDHTVVTTTRVMPTDMLPDFARSMVGDRLSITEIDDWSPAQPDGSRTATVAVTVAKVPVQFHGVITLTASGTAGASAHVHGDLKANVPFIGARVEQAAAPAITAATRAEQSTAAQWLSEGR